MNPGDRVGGWELLAPLGEGGMGVVWEARGASGEVAALKVARRATPRLVDAVVREIATLQRLGHPGVVSVLDHGVHEGRPWYAMPRLQGTSLAQLLPRSSVTAPDRSGPATFTWDDDDDEVAAPRTTGASPHLLPLLVDLCDALAHVHAAGLVHRDLKPDNVIVLGERAVLVDFGLTVRTADDSGREDLLEAAGDAAGVGTMGYLAPEQLAGGFVDARADLYALGCLLYELLTGRLPHPEPALDGLLTRLLHERPPAASALVPGVAAELDVLVSALLEPVPADRPGQAHAVGVTLCRVLGRPEPPRPPRLTVYRASLRGREEVVAGIQGALRDGTESVGFVGEAGSGRTRALLEAVREARSLRRTAIIGTGATIVDGLLDRVEGLLADGRREGPLPSGMADLRWQRASLAAWCPPTEAPVDPEAAFGRRVSALIETVRWLGETDPLVLVVDDLESADRLARTWLGAVLRGVHAVPLPVQAFVSSTAPVAGVRQVLLRPLGAEEVGRMASEMLGAPELAARLGPRLLAATRGRPAAVATVVHTLAARPDAEPEGLLPSLGEVIAARLVTASPSTVAVLTAACVLGTRTDRLAEALALEPDEVDAALQTGVTLDLLRADLDGRLGFPDEEHRRALEERRPADEVRALHDWAARHWEGPLTASLAHHLEGGGDLQGAVGVWAELEEEARGRWDATARQRAWREIARLRPEDAESQVAWARAAREADAYEEAELAAERALALVSDGPIRARALTVSGWLRVDRARHRDALAFFEEALATLPANAVVDRAKTRLDRVTCWLYLDPDAVEPELDAIEDEARDLPEIAIRVVRLRGDHALQRGRFAEARRHLAVAAEGYRERNALRALAATVGNLGFASSSEHDLAAAVAHYADNLVLAARIGFRASIVDALGNLGVTLLVSGHPDAERVELSAVALALEVDDRRSASMFLGNVAEVALAHGEMERALALARLAAAVADGVDTFQWAYQVLTGALACLRSGRHEEADAELRRAEAVLPPALSRRATRIRDVADLARGVRSEVPAWIEALPAGLRSPTSDLTEWAETVWEQLDRADLFEPLVEASLRVWETERSHNDRERYGQLTGRELPAPEHPPLPPEVVRWLLPPATVLAAVRRRFHDEGVDAR
ncbi:MAG: protein kinase [Alphaproteobacteria bacterium]|nr:protein kinase [Alphaproteobacteria bacterium]